MLGGSGIRAAAVMASAGAAAAVAVSLDPEEKKRHKMISVTAAEAFEPAGSRLDPHAMDFGKGPWEKNWDRREPPEPDPEERRRVLPRALQLQLQPLPTATRHLILIRHGQYNLDGATDADKRLTQLGERQAALTGRRLAQLGVPVSRVLVSTMTRAKETADLIAESLPAETPREAPDAMIGEGDPVRPEPDIIGWEAGIDAAYRTDGSRIEAAFRKYFHRADPLQREDSHELMVCHSNVIRYFVCRALQLDPEAWLRVSLRHGSITWVAIRPDGRVTLVCLGDAGFMPQEMLTTS